jgi:hypothetical protein
LKDLLIICEKLQHFDEAYEVIDVLMELGEDVQSWREYIAALKIQALDISDEEKAKRLYKMSEVVIIQRVWLEFCLNKKIDFDAKKLSKFEAKKIWDLIWNFEDKKLFELESIAYKVKLIGDIYRAKGIWQDDKSCEIFELDILRVLAKNSFKDAKLIFEYRCSSCNTILPLFFTRCPSCNALGQIEIEPIIAKEKS